MFWSLLLWTQLDWSQLIIDAVMVLTGCLGTVFLAYGLSDWAEKSAPDQTSFEQPHEDAPHAGVLSEVVNM